MPLESLSHHCFHLMSIVHDAWEGGLFWGLVVFWVFFFPFVFSTVEHV